MAHVLTILTLLLPSLTLQLPLDILSTSTQHLLNAPLPLQHLPAPFEPSSPDLATFLNCSLTNYRATDTPWLEWADPLPASAWSERRDAVARAVYAQGLDAFVMEPGATLRYYADVKWQSLERPMLMVIQPVLDAENNTVTANTTFLVAAFEEQRLRLLDLPSFPHSLQTIVWQEHWSPFDTLLHSGIWASKSPKIMVDGEMRDFISRGLGKSGFDVIGFGGDVERVRQTKTAAEIAIMRAVNTGTASAVREMRKCLVPELTVAQVQHVLHETLRAGGFDNPGSIVEFGEEAASPHGGFAGDKKLVETDFVLIDVDADLYGYQSDLTRTFFPPFTKRSEPGHETKKMREQLFVWDTVHKAQNAAIAAMKPDASCASVDLAARAVIEEAGYGEYFLHRLGHSIGIQVHESPYLNKGNVETPLKPGMLFTAEPGVYVWQRLGVRLEDVMLVREDGGAECLSCGFGEFERATSPWDI